MKKISIGSIFVILFLIALSHQKVEEFDKSLSSLKRKKLKHLTKFHIYGEGWLFINVKVDRNLKKFISIPLGFALFKKKDWSKFRKNMTCAEKLMLAYKHFTLNVPLDGTISQR